MSKYIFPDVLVMMIRSGGCCAIGWIASARGLSIPEMLMASILWWLVTTNLMVKR